MKTFRQFWEEMMGAGPTNNLGGGQIDGTIEGSNYDPNFSPPVKKRKKKIIGLGRGSRKRWMV